MGIYASYGILVLCICFIHTFGSESCSDVQACVMGSCCNIDGDWKCTVNYLGNSECIPLPQTTTRWTTTTNTTEPIAISGEATTTRWTTTTNTTEPIAISGEAIAYGVAGIAGFAIVAMVVSKPIRAKWKQMRTPPSPVVRSRVVAIIYKV